MAQYNHGKENLVSYKVEINDWKIIHDFDINSIMVDHEYNLVPSRIEFSGELINPHIPNTHKADVSLIEDVDGFLHELKTKDGIPYSIFGDVELLKKREVLQFNINVQAALFHRIAMSLGLYKLNYFLAQGRTLRYGKARIIDFDLRPMIRNSPNLNRDLKNKENGIHVKNSIKRIEQSIGELQKARADLILILS